MYSYITLSILSPSLLGWRPLLLGWKQTQSRFRVGNVFVLGIGRVVLGPVFRVGFPGRYHGLPKSPKMPNPKEDPLALVRSS